MRGSGRGQRNRLPRERRLNLTHVPRRTRSRLRSRTAAGAEQVRNGRVLLSRLPHRQPVAADPRLSQPQAGARLVRRIEPGMCRLADQMGRGARHQFLHGRLVLVPGQSPPGALAPRCLRQGPVPQVPEMGRHVGEPQSAQHALAPTIGARSRSTGSTTTSTCRSTTASTVGRPCSSGRRATSAAIWAAATGAEALRHVAGDGQSGGLSGHLLRGHECPRQPERITATDQRRLRGGDVLSQLPARLAAGQSDRFPFAELARYLSRGVARGGKVAPTACSTCRSSIRAGTPGPGTATKSIVAYDRTPELLGKLCRLARQYADETGKKIIALRTRERMGRRQLHRAVRGIRLRGPRPDPRSVLRTGRLAAQPDPVDVGLGPYDLPAVAARTAWEFDTDAGLEGWTANGDVAGLEAKDGCCAAAPAAAIQCSRSPVFRSKRTDSIDCRSVCAATAISGSRSSGPRHSRR